MREVAEGVIVATFVALVVMGLIGPKWAFQQSPATGICYEVQESRDVFKVSRAMSPVDSSYCDEEPPDDQ